jgi:hypothetical protein
VPKAHVVTDEHLPGAKDVPVLGIASVGDPLPCRGLYQLAQDT